MRLRSRPGILLGVLAGALLTVGLLGVGSAGAHAQLDRSEPAAGATVDRSPPQILLVFNEPVEASLGGIRVYDTDAQRVDSGEITRPGGDETLAAPLPDLPDGTYVVTYRVVSADSHPIDGGFTFQVGAGTPAADTDALVDQLLASEGGDSVAGALHALARTAVFVGLAGLVGTLGFALLVSPQVLESAGGLRVLRAGWAVLALSSAASIGLQGVTAAALPLGDLFDPSVWSAVLETRYGTLAGVRLVVLVTIALPLLVPARFTRERPASRPESGGPERVEAEGPPTWWRVLAVTVTAALVLSIALAGHAGAGSAVPFWAMVDSLHLVAMALWLGGLVTVAALLRSGPSADGSSRDAAWAQVERFSGIALGCVVVLVVTGTAQSVRQVGSLDALTSTTYGRVLLLKLFLVLVLIGTAAFSRSVLRDRRRERSGEPADEAHPVGPGAMTAGADADRHFLRISVIAELAVGALVLVASAFLIDLVPAKDSIAQPYATVVEVEDLRVDVVVDPASTGSSDVHIYVFSGGTEPVDIVTLEASLSLPAEDIGPLELPLDRAGPNHFSAYGYDIPIEGDWELDIALRPDGAGVLEATTVVPIE